MGLTKEQVLLEYARCMKNTPYALKTYLQTYDQTVSKYVPLELFEDQINLLKDYEDYEENIALKYRQAGVTTVTAAWVSKKLVFAKKEKPEKILIIANKLDTAVEMANKVRGFVDQWPSWVGTTFSDEKNAQKHYKLSNGCEVKAVATSKDALRGYTPTILIFDEAAYIEADNDFWSACMASLSTGGKVIVISTPNGYDPIYYEIYDQAHRGFNNFKISEMFWYRDPRYTKDLYLVKCPNIVDFLLYRDDYPDVEIIDYSSLPLEERTNSKLDDLIKLGFKPCSSWFEKMVKKLKYDKRKVSQELECNFLGSGDNVFDVEQLQKIKQTDIQDPEQKLMGGSLWIWKDVVQGHRYIMGIDVSRGDSEDYSTFTIIDFDEQEQVLEYVAKVPPDSLAEIALKWANIYSCFVVIDITGGMGISTSQKMKEFGFRNLYVEGQDPMNKWKYNPKLEDKVPGINFSNKRVQIIASFEESVRHGFKIRSLRLWNEMNTYIYMNGKPDHQKGHHDDLIMSIAMSTYVAESSFNKLQKATEVAKKMIESWQVSSSDVVEKTTFFNPSIPNTNVSRPNLNNNPTQKDYENYGWLFGGMRR
jgi:hypothetical protein